MLTWMSGVVCWTAPSPENASAAAAPSIGFRTCKVATWPWYAAGNAPAIQVSRVPTPCRGLCVIQAASKKQKRREERQREEREREREERRASRGPRRKSRGRRGDGDYTATPKSGRHSTRGGQREEPAQPTRRSSRSVPARPILSLKDSVDVCCLCEDGGLLIICDGPCMRSFHTVCLGMDEVPDGKSWLCPDCEMGTHMCLECGEVGDDNKDGPDGVFKCSVRTCGRFYHRACTLNSRHQYKLYAGGKFKCPQHVCHACEDPTDTTPLVACNRCPVAYHLIECCNLNKCVGVRCSWGVFSS